MPETQNRRPRQVDGEPAEVLLEFQPFGGVVKVTAVDPITQVEVSIQGPASAGEATLRRTAIAKLRYVLAQRHRGGRD